MKLINNQGFYLRDIEKNLGAEKFREFDEWIKGQTVFKHKGKVCVYKWDFERFMAGLPVID